MQRYDYLKPSPSEAGDALAVCTGWAAREWWAVRPGDGNLKTRTLGTGIIHCGGSRHRLAASQGDRHRR